MMTASPMRTQSPDTSPEAERVLIELLRAAPPWRRLQLATQMSSTARKLALAGLRLRHPDSSIDEFRRLKAELFLGSELSKVPAFGDPVLLQS
jgi:hypothetical protein